MIGKDLNNLAVEDYAIDKYFYAGGSARFMFEYTTDSLKQALLKLLDSRPCPTN